MLSPIKLPTAKEQATSELRKAILSRQFSEGEIITIDGTARLLGVSATPVRDAFAELERDGLIQLRQNRGAVVLGVTEKYIRDHYGVRALLETVFISLTVTLKAHIRRNGANGIKGELTALKKTSRKSPKISLPR